MDYIDLEEQAPKVDTTYKVLIRTVDGEKRESKGLWKFGKGFELVDDSLKSEEFIAGWKAM